MGKIRPFIICAAIYIAVGAIAAGVAGRVGRAPVVLMYHSISDSDFQVTAGNFEAQIGFLSSGGFTFLFPEEIAYAYRHERPVVITFDDGFRDNYEVAFPILKRYNAKAVVFMITGEIGNDGFLTAEQIKSLEASGLVRVEPHTRSHVDLTQVSLDGARRQIQEGNAALSEITGREHRVFAYPFGGFDAEIKKIVAEYYDIAFAVENGSRDMLAFRRHSVFNDMLRFRLTVAAPEQLVLAAALFVAFGGALTGGVIIIVRGRVNKNRGVQA